MEFTSKVPNIRIEKWLFSGRKVALFFELGGTYHRNPRE